MVRLSNGTPEQRMEHHLLLSALIPCDQNNCRLHGYHQLCHGTISGSLLGAPPHVTTLLGALMLLAFGVEPSPLARHGLSGARSKPEEMFHRGNLARANIAASTAPVTRASLAPLD